MSNTDLVASVNSSELSDYYKHMAESTIYPQTDIDDKMEKTFKDIGGCGYFQIFVFLAIALGIHS